VIADDNDFNEALSIIKNNIIYANIIFQPAVQGAFDLQEYADKLRWLHEKVIENSLDIRVLPQTHKIAWGNKKGV